MAAKTEADRFAAAGAAYAEAHQILADGCTFPPSFEGFRHLLDDERARTNAALIPQEMARRIVQTYRVIR